MRLLRGAESLRTRIGRRHGRIPAHRRGCQQPRADDPGRRGLRRLNPQVNLVSTLDGGQFTVFAPTNDAFAKLDAATIDKLKTDSALLTSILTYHVVPGQAAPDQVVGTHKTVQGATVTVSGSGDHLMVNNANVVCGGVKTTNATVYLIDSVLLPPS